MEQFQTIIVYTKLLSLDLEYFKVFPDLFLGPSCNVVVPLYLSIDYSFFSVTIHVTF